MKEWDVNAIDSTGSSAFIWAARRGHEGALKVLLTREDVNPNTPDTKLGRRPLSWAARNGHDDVVKLLLTREDVNPNTPDTKYGWTPLCWAARNGSDGVVKIFLEREDVRIDTPDSENETPVSLALSKGYNQVVKMLQDRINGSSATVGNASHEITSHSSGHGVECVVDMQSGGGDHGTNIADLDGQKTLPSANLNEREQILDCNDSDPSSGESHLSSTEHSNLPPLPP
ncbi:ankyrin [Choiromyces venosus 120613-1]|uniref:Ankyrin n=1 Tax=Choiromyces venosus 120613-1 TaxID=1336337 RepID=A0A3N4IYV0_9PEZI|nr:ankyrin [Choiromyces venosus 120613-1]